MVYLRWPVSLNWLGADVALISTLTDYVHVFPNIFRLPASIASPLTTENNGTMASPSLRPPATIVRAFNFLLVTVIKKAGHSVLWLLGHSVSLFVCWVPSASDLTSCSHTSHKYQYMLHAICPAVHRFFALTRLCVCAGVWPKRVIPVVRQHGRGAPVRPSGAGHHLGRSGRCGRLGQPLHQVLQVPAVAWFWFMTVIDSGNHCIKFYKYHCFS